MNIIKNKSRKIARKNALSSYDVNITKWTYIVSYTEEKTGEEEML